MLPSRLLSKLRKRDRLPACPACRRHTDVGAPGVHAVDNARVDETISATNDEPA